MEKTMKIDVMMDEKTFKDFALFDNFSYRKIWKRPILFAGIFIVFALLCFAMRGMREQADLLGTVLLIIGLGLPMAYFGLFFRTLGTQLKRLKLGTPRLFYTILLSDAPDGIVMTAKGAVDQRFSWASAERAYRSDEAVYLYVAPGSALILPFRDAKGGADGLCTFLTARLGEERVTAL